HGIRKYSTKAVRVDVRGGQDGLGQSLPRSPGVVVVGQDLGIDRLSAQRGAAERDDGDRQPRSQPPPQTPGEGGAARVARRPGPPRLADRQEITVPGPSPAGALATA